MSYQVITDFRGGLDARKHALSLPPGTLLDCVNGHITPGAEIEKRKAYVYLENPDDATAVPLPADSFGLEPTATGLVCFGSTDHSAWNFPTGYSISYQRLQHPAVLAGTAYDAAKHAMTAVIHARAYGDHLFVAATFADGYSFAYYNGKPVDDFTSGLHLPYQSTTSLLTDALVQAVNNTLAYTAVKGSGAGNTMDVFGLPGNDYQSGIVLQLYCNLTVTSQLDADYVTSVISSTNGYNTPVGSQIKLAGKVYKFVAALTAEGDILIGTRITDTLTNLFNAINHTGTPGTDYDCAAVNANGEASSLTSNNLPQFTLTARTPNTDLEIGNNLGSLEYLKTGDPVAKSNSKQAAGQFKISAVIMAVSASGVISTTGTNPTAGDTITVGGVVYTFRSIFTGPANEIKIQATMDDTLDVLVKAINGTAAPVLQVSLGSVGSATCYAKNRVLSGASATVTVESRLPGAAGNAYVLSDTSSNLTTPGLLAGGVDSGISQVAVGPTFAYGTLTSSGVNPSDGDKVTIGGQTYTLKTALTPLDGEVLIGATASDTMQNIIFAVNLTGVKGVNYYLTAKNASVAASPSVSSGIVRLQAVLAGTSGNLIALVSSTATIVASATALAGASDSINLLAGAVYGSASLDLFGQLVVNAINDYSTTSGYTAEYSSGAVYLSSVAGNTLSNDSIVTVTTTGACCCDFCGFNFSDGGTFPAAAFHIDVRIDGFSILSAALSTSGYASLDLVVAALAANINDPANTNCNGTWCAVHQGTELYISHVVCSSDEQPSSASVVMDTTNTVTVAQIGISNLTATVSPTTVRFIRSSAVSGAFGSVFSSTVKTAESSPIVVNCKAAGGYPPYRYNWQYVSGADGFVVQNQGSPNVTFFRRDNAGSNTALWACLVTDSLNNTVLSNSVSVYQP